MAEDETMFEERGGKVAEVIKELIGKEKTCYCGKTSKIDNFLGYRHSGGVPDKEGVKWWIFWRCPKCEYDFSWRKLYPKD